MRGQVQFSIISEEYAAQFLPKQHFQRFYLMMFSSETYSCCCD